MLDSTRVERKRSKTLASTSPFLTVHCTIPEPSRMKRKTIPPPDRLFWSHPRTRTSLPSRLPVRTSWTRTASFNQTHQMSAQKDGNGLFKNPRNQSTSGTIVRHSREDH